MNSVKCRFRQKVGGGTQATEMELGSLPKQEVLISTHLEPASRGSRGPRDIYCRIPPWFKSADDASQSKMGRDYSNNWRWELDLSFDEGFSGEYYPKENPLVIRIVDEVLRIDSYNVTSVSSSSTGGQGEGGQGVKLIVRLVGRNFGRQGRCWIESSKRYCF
jgi:hypothetical protein